MGTRISSATYLVRGVHLWSRGILLAVGEFKFGVPRTYVNQACNEMTEWPDGLKVVRMTDGRVKTGRSARRSHRWSTRRAVSESTI